MLGGCRNSNTVPWGDYLRGFGQAAAIALGSMAVAAILTLVGVLPPDAVWLAPFVLIALGVVVAVSLLYVDMIRSAIDDRRARRRRP